MESCAFSHTDECLRIEANSEHQLKIYTIDEDDFESEFVPPQENRYNQLLQVKFGLNADTFSAIRRDSVPNWKITKVVFYNSAFSIRHENIYDKPVLKYSAANAYSGFRAEQILTETIPFDNIMNGAAEKTIKIDLVCRDMRTEASWIIDISKDKIIFSTPAEMSFERPRTHL